MLRDARAEGVDLDESRWRIRRDSVIFFGGALDPVADECSRPGDTQDEINIEAIPSHARFVRLHRHVDCRLRQEG
jgi:hypothetical protein